MAMASSKVLFFGSHSALHALLLLPRLRAAEHIYFHEDPLPARRGRWLKSWDRANRKLVAGLVGLVGRSARIRAIPQETLNDHWWECNVECVDAIGRLASRIQRSGPYQLVLAHLPDPTLTRFYQHQLTTHIPKEVLFWKIAQDLQRQHGSVLPVPTGHHTLSFHEEGTALRGAVPRRISVLNQIGGLANGVRNLAILMIFPSIYLARDVLRKGIRLRPPLSVRKPVLQTIIWGMEKDTFSGGVRYDLDDTFLAHESLELTDIAFRFRTGGAYTDEKRLECKSALDARGVSYIDAATARSDLGFVWTVLRTQLALMGSWWKLVRSGSLDGQLGRISYFALHHMFEKLKELRYVDYRVEFCMDDMDAAHVVRSIVSRRHGKKTVGVQHRAATGPHTSPQLCFSEYDSYCTQGAAQAALHAPHWDSLQLAETGSMFIDTMIELATATERVDRIRQRVDDLYGEHEYRAVVALPSAATKWNMASRWDELCAGLNRFLSTDLDCVVFLRFREAEHMKYPHAAQLLHLAKQDHRIVVDNTNFTSHELMTVSDVYIANSASSGMIEAVAIAKPAFTFDFRGNTDSCYGRFGKDMVLNTRHDLMRTFQGLTSGFVGFDCDWTGLRVEYNYHYDGRCLRRIQDLVVASLDPVASPFDFDPGAPVRAR